MKSRAGYLASTWRTASSAAAAAERLTEEGEDRNPCTQIYVYHLHHPEVISPNLRR